MSKFTKILVLPLMVLIMMPAFGDSKENSALNDAWLDGRLDTVILLNRHLNPFKIDTEVNNGVAVISGTVDSNVEKSLTTELAKGIKGITDVENNLQVSKNGSKQPAESDDKNSNDLTDAAITTAISTKLLMNTDINSLNIDVDTDNKKVNLNGYVESDAERDLVEEIAKNTFDVEMVKNNLKVKKASS